MSFLKMTEQEKKTNKDINLKLAKQVNHYLNHQSKLVKSNNMKKLKENIHLFEDKMNSLSKFEQDHFKSITTNDLSTFFTDEELSKIDLLEFLYLTCVIYRFFFEIESSMQAEIDTKENIDAKGKAYHQPSREMSITFFSTLNTFSAIDYFIEKEIGKKINEELVYKIFILAMHATLILTETENKKANVTDDLNRNKPSLRFLSQVEVLRFIMKDKCPGFAFGFNDFSNSIFLHGDVFQQNLENAHFSEKNIIDFYTNRLLILEGDDYKNSQQSVSDFLNDNKEDLSDSLLVKITSVDF